MGVSEKDKETLVAHFGNEKFATAFLGLVDHLQAHFYAKFQAVPKKGFYDEAMELMAARGGNHGLEILKIEIMQLIKVADDES